MTILEYITPSRLGGAEEYFLRLVALQRAAGHRVIAVTKRDTPLRGRLEALRGELGIEVHGWHTHGKVDPQTLGRLVRLIRRERVDLVHTHLTTASWMGALAGRATRTPVVAHVHAADSKTWFQHADYLIAVARGVKAHLVAQGVDARRVPVCYYGLDIARFDNLPARDDLRRELGLPLDVPIVGVAASLQERKGHKYLLQAMELLARDVPDLHAAFAGEGPEEAALREQAQALGLADRVHFLGFCPDVRRVVPACDVFCLPSRKEGLSIAVMEAMAMRVPVLATRIAGMPEVVEDGQSGLLVEPFQAAPLAQALKKMLNDDGFRHALAEQARRALEEKWEQKACFERLDLFERAVVEARNGRGARVDCSEPRWNA
jgi:glycosyltransferase involved in cell wall biosynthesis